MKKLTAVLAGFAVTAGVLYAIDANKIDERVTPATFREIMVKEFNTMHADVVAVKSTADTASPKADRITLRTTDAGDALVLREKGTGANYVTVGPIANTLAGNRTVTLPDADVNVADIQARSGRITLQATELSDVLVLRGRSDGEGATVSLQSATDITSPRTITFGDDSYDLVDIKSKANAAVVGDVLTVGESVSDRIATVTVESSLDTVTQIVGWWSATAGGAAEDTSLVSVEAGSNTAVLSDSESPTVVFTTHTNGTGILTITVNADVDRYFNVVQRNGAVVSSAIMELRE